MAVRDEKGWTWGGVLKGVAYVAGAVVVGSAIYMGAAAGAGLLFGLEKGSIAASMVGMGASGLASIADIPNAFVTTISNFLSPATTAVTSAATDAYKAAGSAVGSVTDTAKSAVATATETATQAYDGAKGLVSEYGKPAAAVAGAGVAGYWAGKVGGRKEQAQSFRDQVTKGRESAALADLGRA